MKPMVWPKEELKVGSCQLPGKKEHKAKPAPQAWSGLGRLWFATAVVEKAEIRREQSARNTGVERHPATAPRHRGVAISGFQIHAVHDDQECRV